MDIPKGMQDKLAAIRDAATLEDLTTYLTTPGLPNPAAAMKAVQLGVRIPRTRERS